VAENGQVRLTGQDGAREFPVMRAGARRALRSFIKNRLPAFGPQQDARPATDR
jgi:deoxyribodipyrimidine photolyase-related protein